MKQIISLLLALVIYTSAFTQIQGYVYDKQNNQALPGCMVKIKELNKATLTDVNGFFSFDNLPKGTFTLEFTYLGYQDAYKTITYSNKPVSLKIYLDPAPIITDEIIITGWLPSTQHTSAMKVESIKLKTTNIPLPNVLSSLSFVPGVDVISKGVGIGSPVIRGLSKTNIVVLNNGFRLEDFQFSENHPFFIDQFGTKKIEVIKGPSSLLYGSDAIGGVINVLWEDPASINHISSDMTLQYNSNTSGMVANIGIKASSGKISWGLRSGYNANKDMHDGTGTQVKNTRFFTQNFKGFLILNNEKSSHKFYYQYDRNKLGLCVNPALALVNDNRLYPENFYQDLVHVFAGNKNTFFINSNTTVNANFSYEFNRRGVQTVSSQPLPINMYLNNFTYDIYQTTENQKLTFITGSQGWLVYNKNHGTSAFLPDYNSANASLYALLHLNLTRKIHIITGLRYDHSMISFIPVNDSTTQTIKHFYNNISGSLGGTIHLAPSLLLRLNSATAYRNPNVAELGEFGIHAYRYEIGNPDLKPQHSFENDISIHLHRKKILADIALFYNKLDNYIYLSPTSDTAANGMKIYSYRQSNATIYGLETGLQLSLSHSLNTKVIYSYLHTSDAAGNPLPLIPQNKLKAYLNFTAQKIGPVKNIHLQLNPVYAFAYNHPAPEEQPSPSYFLINASITGDISINQTHTLKLFILGYNLTNTVYNDHLSTLRDVSFYDMGRNISIGIRYTMDITK